MHETWHILNAEERLATIDVDVALPRISAVNLVHKFHSVCVSGTLTGMGGTEAQKT